MRIFSCLWVQTSAIISVLSAFHAAATCYVTLPCAALQLINNTHLQQRCCGNLCVWLADAAECTAELTSQCMPLPCRRRPLVASASETSLALPRLVPRARAWAAESATAWLPRRSIAVALDAALALPRMARACAMLLAQASAQAPLEMSKRRAVDDSLGDHQVR